MSFIVDPIYHHITRPTALVVILLVVIVMMVVLVVVMMIVLVVVVMVAVMIFIRVIAPIPVIVVTSSAWRIRCVIHAPSEGNGMDFSRID